MQVQKKQLAALKWHSISLNSFFWSWSGFYFIWYIVWSLGLLRETDVSLDFYKCCSSGEGCFFADRIKRIFIDIDAVIWVAQNLPHLLPSHCLCLNRCLSVNFKFIPDLWVAFCVDSLAFHDSARITGSRKVPNNMCFRKHAALLHDFLRHLSWLDLDVNFRDSGRRIGSFFVFSVIDFLVFRENSQKLLHQKRLLLGLGDRLHLYGLLCHWLFKHSARGLCSLLCQMSPLTAKE